MVVLLVGGILIAIAHFLDWGRYRDNVEKGVSSLVSQNISIDGEIILKIFPKPNFKLTEVTIYSGEGFDKPLLYAGSITASFDLTNFLSQTSLLDQLTIDELRIQSSVETVSPFRDFLRTNSGKLKNSIYPLFIPLRVNISNAVLQFLNDGSDSQELIQIQDVALEIDSDKRTAKITTEIPFKQEILRIHGVINNVSDPFEEPILLSLRYVMGAIQGEVTGTIAEIFDAEGLFSLKCSMYGQNISELAQSLDLNLGIEFNSLEMNGKLEGSWTSIAYNRIIGNLTGSDLAIDFTGEIRDVFRRNLASFDLHASSESFDFLNFLGSNFTTLNGVTNVNAKLDGKLGEDLQLRDVNFISTSPDFIVSATGDVSALGKNPKFKLKFETQTKQLQSFLSLLDYEIPIEGSGNASGILIRNGNDFQIDNLTFFADAPTLSFQGTGDVSALGRMPRLSIDFKINNAEVTDLVGIWDRKALFDLDFVSGATGSITIDDGTILASNLDLDILDQKVQGHFSGRLPKLGYSGNADWSLQLNINDIGQFVDIFGLGMSYPEPGEITIHVRPSDNRDELFDLQIGLITNEIDLKIDGEMTILDGLFGFDLSYDTILSASSRYNTGFWKSLNQLGDVRLKGSLSRLASDNELAAIVLDLESKKVDIFNVEGSISEISSRQISADLSFITDSLSDFMALKSVQIADLESFQGTTKIRLTKDNFSLENFDFQIGDNMLSGNIEYRKRRTSEGRSKVLGEIKSSYLNLNELFPPPKKQFLFSEEALPVNWAISNDVRIEFTVDRFLRRNYDLRKLIGKVTSENGIVDARSRSNAFGGDLDLVLILDTRSSPFNAVYRYNWDDIDLALLPVTRATVRDITGQVDLKGGIQGVGDSLHQIVEQGNGFLYLDVDQARFLRGGMELFTTSPINIVEQILRDVSPWGRREKYFDIECGVIGMHIKDGVGIAQPPPDHTIAIKAKEFRLVGFGDLSLADESLSLSVRSKARGLGLSATTIIEQSGLSAIYQPFYRIGGTLLSPKVESDPEGSDLVEKLIKLGSAYVTGGTSVAVLGLIDRLAIEPVGCEGARERAQMLLPKEFP